MKTKFFSLGGPGAPQDHDGDADEHDQEFETKINAWLDTLENNERVLDWKMTSGRLVIFYGTLRNTKLATSERPLCRQCKQRPSAPGLKSCDECREYQRDYRAKQKADKKNIYP